MTSVTAPASAIIHPSDCTYTSCYCEENVYLLIKTLSQHRPSSQLFAVFISTTNETVPFWCQKCSQHPDGFVVWDYHVIALEVSSAGVLVWDLDLKHPGLQFPCTLQQYAGHALQSGTIDLPPQFQRMFRLVPAAALLQHFASDRSHMRKSDGSWCAEPPQYPCITAADGATMNLARYRDMGQDILQDRVQHSHASTQRAGAQRRPDAAGSESAAGSGGIRVQHPCQPAAGLPAQQQQQQPAYAGAALADNASSMSKSGDASHSQTRSSTHILSEGQGVAGHGGPGSRLATWQDVTAAAGSNMFGVVLHESTLLRCLLHLEA